MRPRLLPTPFVAVRTLGALLAAADLTAPWWFALPTSQLTAGSMRLLGFSRDHGPARPARRY
jgi:hypothetical protein